MKFQSLLLLLLSLTIQQAIAQKSPVQKLTNSYFELVRPEFKGDLAYETVAFVEH